MTGIEQEQAGAGSPAVDYGGKQANARAREKRQQRQPRRGAGVASWFADFVVALALFWGATVAIAGSDIRAHAISLPAIAESILLDAAAPGHVGPQPDQVRHVVHRTAKTKVGGEQELILLSLAFAALVACNLAFWRHLRRVYASPRRSVWRRG